MTRRVLLALGALLVVLTGCDDQGPQSSADPPQPTAATEVASPATRPARCAGPPGAETDLENEPPYTANYLYRFRNREGCDVQLDVMMYRKPGPDHHCAPWPPPEIVLMNPTGISFSPTTTRQPTYIGARIYVRDPDGTWREPSLSMGFDPSLALPSEAKDTGYVSDAGRLFVVPRDDRFIYVGTESAIERWTREKLTGCA